MQLSDSIHATDRWLDEHVEVSSTKPDMTWYVALDLIYRDYSTMMKRSRLAAMGKTEFAFHTFDHFYTPQRLREKYVAVRGWNARAREFQDTVRPVWILDGIRYYKHKVGEGLAFGI